MRRHNEIFRGEKGVMLVWSAIIILPLLTLGLVLLGYGRANIAKARAQFNAINLASIGALSSEFKSRTPTETSQTLNSMAMLASAQGFAGVKPKETVQDLSSGLIIFKHNVESPGENKVAVYQRFTLAPLASLVASLGSVKTSGVAQMKPSKLYISVVLDYSRSLLADGNISDLLKAYRVIDPDNPNAEGKNGEISSITGKVEPKGYAQNALPFEVGFPRHHLGWNFVGPVVPNFTWTSPPSECVPGPENACGGGPTTHVGAITSVMTNHFMMYKRAATVLVGVMAQMSRYLDVYVLGAPLPDRAWTAFTSLSQGGDSSDAGVNFEKLTDLDNDLNEGGGIFPAWRYDEPTVSGLQLNTPQSRPLLRGQIDYTYSFDNPKSPLTENMTLSPTRILLRNISVWPRKSAKYLEYEDESGRRYSFSQVRPAGISDDNWFPTAERYFLPAIPYEVEDPGDSFPFDPGPPLEGPNQYGWLLNEVELGFGWPLGAVPLLQLSGRAHPRQDDFPEELRDVYEYRPSGAPFNGSGPQQANLAPLSKEKWKTGYWLCVIRDEMDNGVVDNTVPCQGTEPFPPSEEFYFYNRFNPAPDQRAPEPPSDGRPTSPRCDSGSGVPACVEGPGSNLWVDFAFVWCVHGYPRCAPFPGMPVRCVDPDDPNHPVVPGQVVCEGGGGVGSKRNPPGYTGDPLYRGSVLVPPGTPPTIDKANLFYFLMDLRPTYGGTFHHNMVPNDRCEDFLRRTDGSGRCAGVFVTDGVPRGSDFGGFTIIDESTMLTTLSNRMDRFTETNDARSFTWYLGKKGPLDRVIELARAQLLTESQEELIDILDYDPEGDPNDIPPPETLTEQQCVVFDSIPGTGANCLQLNGYMLPLYRDEFEHFSRFKTIMDGKSGQTANPRRVWVEAKLSSDEEGMTGLGPDDPTNNPVIRSLRGLLAKIKGARVLDK